MANRQIHELTAATGLSGSDRIVVSTAAGNLTRNAVIDDLPFRAAHAGAVARRMAEKLGEQVSVKDFGAIGDGIADDSAAFQAAVDSALIVMVPHGRYRLASRIKVKPNRTIKGHGRENTTIVAEAPLAFEFFRNRGAFQVDPGATTDWNRSALKGMTIQMAASGILVHGHEFRAENLQFRQGVAGGWCIQLHASNECYLHQLAGGYGGGGNGLAASAVRWYAGWLVTDTDDPAYAAELSEDDTATLRQAENTVNYGDSTIAEVSFKGNAVGWTGLKLEHLSTNPSSGVINNLHVNRCQFQAPGSSSEVGAGTSVAAGSVFAKTGSIGLRLHKVLRSTFTVCDMEGTDTAVQASGNVVGLGGGATKFNSFIGCQSFNSRNPWLDSNAELAGSVGRNGFYGGQSTGPLQPRGDNSGDDTIKAGQADFFFPMAAWFANVNRGEARVQIRTPDAATGFSDAQIIITSPGKFASRLDGSTLDDCHPKQRHPTRGLRLDVGGINAAVIGRPVGQNILPGARLELGNGPTMDTMGINGPLKAVVVRDPLLMTPWTAQPAYPDIGSLFNASTRNAIANVADWRGPGIYMHINDGADGGPDGPSWLPALTRSGIMRMREVNVSASIGRSELGAIVLCNHGSTTINLTIPNDLLREDEVGVNLTNPANTLQHTRSCGFFFVQRIGNAEVNIVGASGVTLNLQSGTSYVPRKNGISMVFLRRMGAKILTAYVTHFGALQQGAAETRTTKSAPYTLTANDFGTFLEFNSAAAQNLTVNTGLLPAGTKAASMTVVASGAGSINIVTGSGMTAKNGTSVASGAIKTMWITDANECWLQ